MSNNYVKTSEVKNLMEKFSPENEKEFCFIHCNKIYSRKVSDLKIEISGTIATFIVYFGYNESGNGKYMCYVPDIFDSMESALDYLRANVR